MTENLIDILYGRENYTQEMIRMNNDANQVVNDLNEKIQNKSIEEIKSIIRSNGCFTITEDPRFSIKFWIFSNLAPELDCCIELVFSNRRFIFWNDNMELEDDIDWKKEGF